MTVTVYPVTHRGRKVGGRGISADNAANLLKMSSPTEWERCKEVLSHSFNDEELSAKTIYPSENGFIWAAVQAYHGHFHLTIRPEDVWFAILTQLNFYISAHAEELRGFFVDHEGHKELKTSVHGSSVEATKEFVEATVKKMTGSIKDPEFRDWIIPDFSTTTKEDAIVAGIIMMGTFQAYFRAVMETACGIPSVTLLGEKEDWIRMADRIDFISKLGEEATHFCDMLKPVLEFFVESFENPDSQPVKDFWNMVAFAEAQSSGSEWLSGWILAFAFWDDKGRCTRNAYDRPFPGIDPCGRKMSARMLTGGTISVPVLMPDAGIEARFVAGSVGFEATSSGLPIDVRERPTDDEQEVPPEDGILDSLRPVTGWWLYAQRTKNSSANQEEYPDSDENSLSSWGGTVNSEEGSVEDDCCPPDITDIFDRAPPPALNLQSWRLPEFDEESTSDSEPLRTEEGAKKRKISPLEEDVKIKRTKGANIEPEEESSSDGI